MTQPAFSKVLGTEWSTKLTYMVLALMEAIWTDREEISKETKKLENGIDSGRKEEGKLCKRVAGEGPSRKGTPEAQEEGKEDPRKLPGQEAALGDEGWRCEGS